MESLLKVLVLDDNETEANLTRDLLVAADYDVLVKYDSEEAYAHLADEDEDTGVSYDLLVLDINMPTLDGITLAKRLRKDGVTTPIIFVSGNLTNGIKRSVQGLGQSVGFIQKPVSSDALVSACTDIVSRTQMYVQMGQVQRSLRSFETTLTEFVDPVRMDATLTEKVDAKMNLQRSSCVRLFTETIAQHTSPSALVGRAKKDNLFKIIVTLVGILISGAGYMLVNNYQVATYAKDQVIEVGADLKVMSKDIRVQTTQMQEISDKMDNRPEIQKEEIKALVQVVIDRLAREPGEDR